MEPPVSTQPEPSPEKSNELGPKELQHLPDLLIAVTAPEHPRTIQALLARAQSDGVDVETLYSVVYASLDSDEREAAPEPAAVLPVQ